MTLFKADKKRVLAIIYAEEASLDKNEAAVMKFLGSVT